ncbi:sulfotransferase [Nocardioides guangzhouensis]|uniref:sulfotransferase n=1 Tax=Nocardioides guangzhouensis TaxID=2497878 RepID=UPI0014383500|nr:sulfotransferase [Nocardioides guangzhouensis]
MTRHLLVIGAQRSGTTYLHSLLEAHPAIAMAQPSRPEPKVFLSDELTDRGLDWYRATYFAHVADETVLGDKSTSYIEDPLAPARAARMLGVPFVVALLRDPVTRAVSNWRFSTDNGFENRGLVEALTDCLDEAAAGEWDRATTSVSPFAYLVRGRYADHLRPWLDAFPQTSHVLFTDELLGDPAVIRRLYADLGVDPGFVPPGRDEVVNESEEPAPDLPEELLRRLREYFADSDDALARLCGRRPPWTSDGGSDTHGAD